MVGLKPVWLRRKVEISPLQQKVEDISSKYSVHTVCHEAACPNRYECFSAGTCTFMILGNICTRGCGFCNVHKGIPFAVDIDEAKRVANAVAELSLSHVVVTMVTRDDLSDGGASVCASVIRHIKKISPKTTTEILISDMKGKNESLDIVRNSDPDVIGHNIETVRKKYSVAQRTGNYDLSLRVLSYLKSKNESIIIKSGLMLGFGESWKDICSTLRDLRSVGCDVVTAGQYCSPGKGKVPVCEYVSPEIFDKFREEALSQGFIGVMAAPFVRSSYQAANIFQDSERISVKRSCH